MRFPQPRLILILLISLFGSFEVFATNPVASSLFMTGTMEGSHTLTINYTFTDADGHTESGTTYQWVRYTDETGTVVAALLGTGSTYTLVIADVGFHIACRVTPRDSNGEIGTMVEFRPWDSSNVNPVLSNNISCFKPSIPGTPDPSITLTTPPGICSPRTVNLDVTYTGINYSTASSRPPRIYVTWGDGIVETLVPFEVDITETNQNKERWRVNVNHTYDYDIAGRTASAVAGERCTYTVSITYGYGPVDCSSVNVQTVKATVWDMEDNASLGQIDVNHDPTSTGVPVGEVVQVCEDDTDPIRLFDNTDFNCTPTLENPQPNDLARWVQYVYGTSSTITGNVTINGVSYTPAQLPVYGTVLYQAAPTIVPAPKFTDDIQMPTTANAGETFVVTMRSWNACNTFDRNVLDLNGYNPPQGAPFNVFDIRGSASFQSQPEIANGNSFFANQAPVTRIHTIEIIGKPSPPVAANRDLCSTESPLTLTVSPTVVGITYKWYLTQADALAGINSQATNASFTPTNAQAPLGERKHFFVTGTAGNGCVSDPTEVTLTRRPALAQPTTPTGPQNLCPSSNSVYTIPGGPPPSVSITDAITGNFSLSTEYQWTVPAAVGSVSLGQGTESLTVTSAAAAGSGNLSIVRRYVTPPATSSGDQCNSTARTYSVNVRTRPTANITPDPANVCQGNTLQLNGNPVLPASASGFTPTISAHTWGGSTTILDAANIQQPTILGSTLPAGYGLTYVVTADFGSGVSCSSTLDASVVNVFATPTTATAGADQPLCRNLALPSDPLGGNTPVSGTGTWSQISGPAGGVITFNPNNTTPNATASINAVPGVYVVRWTISTGSGLCSTFENVQLDFGAPPAVPTAGGDQDICASSTNMSGATVPTFETGTWSVTSAPPGGTVSFSNVNSPTATVSLNGAIVFGTYTLRWTFSSGTCTATFDEMNVTFRQAPTATGPADFIACVDSPPTAPFNINLSGTFGGGASNAHWERVTGSGTFSSSGGAIGSNDASNPVDDVYVPTAADFTAGTVQVRLVTDDPTGACTSVNDPVTITIDRLPAAAVAGGNFNTCDATATLGATAVNTGVTPGAYGTWSVGGALYYETFPTVDNNLGITGPSGAATFNHPGGNWSVQTPATTLLDNTDFIRVNAGAMVARDISNNEVIWRSKVVNIAGAVNVSADIAEFGTQVVGDYIRVFYVINGGAEVQFGQILGQSPSDGVFQTFTATTPVGTTVQIVMRARNDGATDEHRLDNVMVSAAGVTLPVITDANSPTSGVTNLQVGSNTFTWTVRSALGVCGSSTSSITITRHPSPVALDPAPQLCDEAANPAQATVTAAYLNSALIKDAVTGIAGSTNRNVQYFIDALRTTPVPDPYLVSNSDVIYTRVTSTNTTPNCVTDGIITFTINLRPTALNQNPEFCEDMPVGSNTRTGINLTSFNNAVKNNVAANSVAWFSDPARTLAIPTPTNVTANDGTIFYARVTDPKGCSNDAEVEITLNPIPGPNPLLGPTDVCADPTAVTLYQLTVNNAGFTYNWSIPDPPFDKILGGSSADFLVLLGFPTVASNSISVTETSNKGCTGNPNTKTITVGTSPPAITILDPALTPGPGSVCEGQSGVVYTVATLANTTYAWTVPAGSSIIAGQGSSSITVNFGTIAGQISVVPSTTTGCAGSPDTYNVAINPRPSLSTLPATVCSDAISGITLSGTIAVGSVNSFNITNITVPPGLSPASRPFPILNAPASEIFNHSYTNTTGGNLTVQYTVVPVSALGCEGAPQIVNLTIRPEPVLAPNLNDEICSTTDAVGVVLSVASGSFPADQYVIASITNVAGLTQTAGAQAVPGTYASGILLDDKWRNTTGAPATIEYMIHPRNSGTGCLGDPAIPVIITVNPEPIISPLAPETICSGDSPATPISPSIPGSTFNWTVVSVTGLITGNTNGSGPFGTRITDVLINNGATAGSVTYAITGTGPGGMGSCTGAAENLVVSVNPSPTANSIIQTICSDAAGGNTVLTNLTLLNSSINNSGATITWYSDLALTSTIPTPTAHTMVSGVAVYANVDNTQCSKVATVLYTINPRPSVTASIAAPYNGFQLSCNGASDGSITAVPANGVGPYLFSINGGTSFFTTPTFNGLSTAGNPFVVRTRDSNGCIADSAPLTIVAPTAVTGSAAITSNFNGEDVSCQTSANGAITVTPGGGTGTYTYRLLELPSNTTGDASGIYTGLRAGAYTFVVKDGNNCQFTTSTITVTEPSPITASAALTTPVICNGNSNGIITVTASGGTLVSPNYSFTISPGGTNNTTGVFNGLAAGNYTVTVVDDNGCPKVSNVVSVTQPSILTAFASVTSNYNGAKISCVGANDAQVTAIANGGNGGFTYVLDQVPLNTTGAATGIFTGLGPGSYSITVTDVGPCSVTSALVSVTEPTQIAGTALVTGTISCNGGSDGQITVSGTGGTGAYSFQQIAPAGPTNATGIFTGLSQGSYDFQVSDLNGCSDGVTLPIAQPTMVTASAAVTSNYNGAQVTCFGASNGVITVTGGGGTGTLTYVFDQFTLTNTTGQFTGVFSGVPAGTNYSFTVKDSKNCTVGSNTINVTQPTVVASSGVVSSNYNGEDIRCVGSSDGAITISSSGGTGAYSYNLDQVPSNTSGNASGIYTGLGAGTFTVTARDVNNCSVVTVPITLTPPAALTGSATITSNYNGRQVTCNGSSDGVITVTSGGGVGGFDFVLNEMPGNVSGATTGIFSGVPSGSYTVTITDDNTCQRVTTVVTITDPPVLNAASSVTSNYNSAQISCNGASDGTIKVTPTGGTSGYTYTFVQIPGNTTGAATGIFTGIPAGVYTFNVRDVNNCPTTTVPVTITQPTSVSASAVVETPYNGQAISCNGLQDGTITVTSSGGTGAISYVFNQFALTNLSGKFSGVFSGVGAGTGYTFTATDINGCPITTTPVNVTQPAALAATLSATSDYNGFDISCFNLTDGEISVVAPTGGTGTRSYLLLENPGNVTGQTSGVFTGLRAGSYRVRVTDQNFCQFITTAVPVVQPTDINVQIAITSSYNGYHVSCIGASDGAVTVTTIAGGATASGVTYTLDQIPGNSTGNTSGVYTGLPSNLYTVTARDANTCTKTSLPVVMIDPLPLFEGIVGLDKAVCLGGNPTAFTELATAFGGVGNYAYQWQQSTDGTLFTNVLGATSATFDPPVLPVTTFFKRRITSGSCATLESNTVKVTVNPLPTATLAPSKSPVCEGDFFLLNFTFTGQAPFYFDYNDGTNFTNDRLGAAVTPVPVLNYAATTTYTITEVKDFNGCVANVLPAPVTVPVVKINPVFNITSSAAQCSGGQFDFTYTVDPNTEYTWIWGDGQTDVIPANPLATGAVVPISHIYESMNTSGTTSFPVILTAINTAQGCGPKQTNKTVQVYPNILINLFPDKTEICGGDQITFTNPTAGGTTHHWFYRQQGVVEKKDERTFVAASDQTFLFSNTTTQNPITYELVYEVNNANCAADTVIEITVYREVAASFSKTNPVPLFIGGNANMTFTNTSVPIDAAEFRYDWDFGTGAAQAPVSGVGPFNFNYTAPGTKTVKLVATNLIALANGMTCNSTYQETFNILLPPLVAGFEYTPQATCFPSNITITRNLATGNTFEWRLVDGNGRQLLVTNDTLPTFTISSAGRYIIFQTTKNTLTGQTASADNSATANNAAPYNVPIDIYQAPFAGFEARPTVVYVPDTQLQVFNMSSSPVDPLTATSYPIEYRWYFGDGTDTLSTADDPANFEPSHFYQNEGAFDIALLAVNDHGNGAICYDTAIKRISAKAAGFTRIPNAFTPSPNGPSGGVGAGGNSVNDVFLPVAKGIVDFQMQIFDRWGNLVFQSLDKTIGWDGYDKNGNLLPAGVYVYKLTLRLSNDQRTTQIGDVTLIR